MNVEPIKPAECEACHFPTPELEHCAPLTGPDAGPAWLCQVCRRAPVLRALGCFPAGFRGERDALATIGYVANLILERLPPAFPDVGQVVVPVPEGLDPRELADCGNVDDPM